MTLILALAGNVLGQTTTIIVNNGSHNSSGHVSKEYRINGIPKSQDIGGVDVSAEQGSIPFGFSSGGFAYNGTLPVVDGVTLTNYNSKPVTVILKLIYKTNYGRKPYPRFYNDGEQTLTVVLPSGTSKNPSKYISLSSSGNNRITEIISADMIVRPLK